MTLSRCVFSSSFSDHELSYARSARDARRRREAAKPNFLSGKFAVVTLAMVCNSSGPHIPYN